jgi:hypothetical protein
MLPIEPERFEADSRDSESVQSFNPYRDDRQHPYSSRSINRNDEDRTPTCRSIRSPSPFTTTSPHPPPPTEKPRTIDQLMSQLQKTQSYSPSNNSMFSGPSNPISYPNSYSYGRGPPSAPLYGAPMEMLHAQRSSVTIHISRFRCHRLLNCIHPSTTPPTFSAVLATAPVMPTLSASRSSSRAAVLRVRLTFWLKNSFVSRASPW